MAGDPLEASNLWQVVVFCSVCEFARRSGTPCVMPAVRLFGGLPSGASAGFRAVILSVQRMFSEEV